MSRKHGQAAEYCSKNDDSNVQILGFFGDKFHKENLHFKVSNFGDGLNLMQGWQEI